MINLLYCLLFLLELRACYGYRFIPADFCGIESTCSVDCQSYGTFDIRKLLAEVQTHFLEAPFSIPSCDDVIKSSEELAFGKVGSTPSLSLSIQGNLCPESLNHASNRFLFSCGDFASSMEKSSDCSGISLTFAQFSFNVRL